jgi:serine protease Do
MSTIDELGAAIGSIAASVGPAVVGIGSRQRGSGFVVADGRVVTNAHNLRGEEVTVTFADGRRARGTVAGADLDGDLAVIAVDTAGIAPVAWGDRALPAIGTPVFGLSATPDGAVRTTFGFVSALGRAFRGPGGRRIAGSIEHTAPLAPGSSGGPVVDAAGRLLGIDTNRLGEGFYLAVPADATLRDRVEALGRGETPSRVHLGVAVAPAEVARRLRRSVGLPDRDGVLVRGVEPGSPAAEAGVAEGDLIVAVGGRSVASVDDLFDALAGATLPLEVSIVRGADDLALTVDPVRAPGDA